MAIMTSFVSHLLSMQAVLREKLAHVLHRGGKVHDCSKGREEMGRPRTCRILNG